MDRVRGHRPADRADQQAKSHKANQRQDGRYRHGRAWERTPIVGTGLLEDTTPFSIVIKFNRDPLFDRDTARG